VVETVRRHEILRTEFRETVDGTPTQVIKPWCEEMAVAAAPWPLELKSRDAAELELALAEILDKPFDLASGPLFRAQLLRLGAEEHVLVLAMHHAVADGWSLGVLLRELGVLYAAAREDDPTPLPPLPLQYADFAEWQRARLAGARFARELAYWKERLAGAPPLLELPTDYPRPPLRTYQGAAEPVRIEAPLTQSLRVLARRERVTPFMVLLAAFQALLARYSSIDDIVVGTPVAGRLRPELEELIGYFANTLALRTDMSGNPTFRELLARVRETTVSAFDHQELPFEKIVEVLQPERTTSHSPIFQTMFVLQNAHDSHAFEHAARGPTVEELFVDRRTATFDLSLALGERGDVIVGALEYATDLFTAATAVRLSQQFITLLDGALANPDAPLSELPMLDEAERRRVLVCSAGPETLPAQGRFVPVHVQVAAQAARTPAGVAVRGPRGERLDYHTLRQRVCALAARLRELGVSLEARVAVCLELSPDLIVALLAVLEVGGTYIPLEPTQPTERLAFMLADSGCTVLLTDQTALAGAPGAALVSLEGVIALCVEESTPPSLWQENGGVDRRIGVLPDQLAYVLYTSGSTGRPKGVAVTHGGLANYVQWSVEAYRMRDVGEVPLHSSVEFDLTVTSIFGPLIAGQTIVILPPTRQAGEHSLSAALREGRHFGLIKLTPAHLSLLDSTVDGAYLAGCARTLVLGGEALHYRDIKRWRSHSPDVRVVNEYGPTETVVGCCVYDAETFSDMSVPIGRPIANTQLYVLDRWGALVPPGVQGELYIGGAGVARGYVHRPGLTAECFVPDPFALKPGARMYRTGDVVRFTADGAFHYVGRMDFQVKVRGFRIELGEVESVLREHPAVRDVVVVLHGGDRADAVLAGYVTSTSERTTNLPAELRAHARCLLPEHMVPATLTVLPELPITFNGKVDRAALPRTTGTRASAAEFIPPSNEFESTVIRLWREVLELDVVGAADNFFDLGGNSFRLIRVANRLSAELGREIPVTTLFRFPQPRSLAAWLQQRDSVKGESLGAAMVDRTEELRQGSSRIRLLRQLSAMDSNGAL
jgi:amino acid adenylation domain-containing protein